MTGADRNLRGDAPTSSDALVLCDLLSTFDFPAARKITARLELLAPTLQALRARADRAGVPVVYVNDNVGAWRSERSVVLSALDEPHSKFPAALRSLLPRDDDYFILKPKHSAFFGTPLASLLRHLETKRVVLCGMATDICVLFTAHDAYLEGLDLVVPVDGVASVASKPHAMALELMRRALKARTPKCRSIRWRR